MPLSNEATERRLIASGANRFGKDGIDLMFQAHKNGLTTSRYGVKRITGVSSNDEPLDKARMTLGARIEERRIAIGISQAELARRVGVRQSTINSLINGDSRSSRSIVKIAQVLHTTPAYLAGEISDPEENAPLPPPPIALTARLEVTLGSEEALALMFEGMLAGLDPKASRASQARLLARKLPIALSSLQGLQTWSGTRTDHPAASSEADADLATANHEVSR